jgi:hypothetical protein
MSSTTKKRTRPEAPIFGLEAGSFFTAEDVGFEPTRLSPAGFQDRCTRPLCESSVGEATRV